jgi:PAS domain S-box-containing protein
MHSSVATAKLTPRQQQVLESLLTGQSKKEIAFALHISAHTVHNHVKAVYQAFGVSSRGELLARCLGAGTAEDAPAPAAADRTARTEPADHLQTILRNAPDRILQVDRQGIIHFINNTVTGYSPEQLVGRSMFEFTAREDHARLRQALEAVFTVGTEQEYVVRGRGHDGVMRPYHSRLSPVVKDGGIVQAIIVAREADEGSALAH